MYGSVWALSAKGSSLVSVSKGLAKLGNLVGDANVSQFSRAVNMCFGNKFCYPENKKCFLPGVKNSFASRTQILRPKHMFPSLATPGSITRNIVSATMFPSLARPLDSNVCQCLLLFRLFHNFKNSVINSHVPVAATTRQVVLVSAKMRFTWITLF